MKKALVLNFFPAFYPPSSGGEQRYYYLYKYLSRGYDVTLLSPTHHQVRDEIIEHTPHFREHRVPKEDVHINLHGRLHQEKVGSEVSGLVCGLAAGHERGFRRAYRQHAREADFIIHECPHMLDYDEYLGMDGKPRVYNSYNVEFVLATDMFNRVAGDNYATHIYDLERRLVEASAQVFATCGSELEAFKQWYGCPAEKLAIVPNGFEPRTSEAALSPPASWTVQRPFVVFMGSAHPPNVQAAQFILQNLAPVLPDITFVFIGSVCNTLRADHSNVVLLGLVEESTKAWLLRECSAALNPMFTGAGTNLKITDYMSHGSPVLTTPFGVRGISVVDGEHCYVRPLPQFADAIQEALSDTERSQSIGKAGKALIFRKYTWEHIAEEMAKDLAEIAPIQPAGRVTKPRVLVVNDFSVDCPQGGGQVRIHQLYRELARDFEITLLCLSGEPTRRETILGPDIRQVAIPKTSSHLEAETEIERLSGTSTRDIISLLYCADNTALKSEFRNRGQMADVIIFCHPYLAALATLVPTGARVIYEALNHETSLKRHLLAAHPLAKDLIAAVEAAETHIVQVADQIVCVSAEDGERFSAMAPGKPVLLIRNGVTAPAETESLAQRDDAERPARALFVGSAHPPNIESVRFLVTQVAPAIPEIEFLIVGSVCDALDKKSLPKNVISCGFLDDNEKAALMHSVRIGLNPMFSGSGSNLKLADYFAAGLPVVSTPFGIRGFDVAEGVHVRIATEQQFADAIRDLNNDRALRLRMSTAARQYAEQDLSWRTLAAKYGAGLKTLLASPQKTNKRSLLAITYRYTDVPQGGAEVYFAELLKQIGELNAFDIDIATIDVARIENRLHFSASYKAAEVGRTIPSFARSLFVFPLEMPAEVEIRNGVEKLFALWQQESIAHARSFLDYYEQTLLMGGWHFAEQGPDQHASRWTSGFSEIFCAAGTTAIELNGHSLAEKDVRVSFESHQLLAVRVEGKFAWRLDLPPHQSGVLRIFCEPERLRDDPRRLGLRIHAIRETVRGKQQDISLLQDYESYLRSRDVGAWVRSLIQIAESRNREKDEIFCRVRGPHSSQLEQFVLRHGREYDAALIQGVPFSITPEALRCTKEVGLPTVLLPHVHMEDRYYHWQTFNNAFRSADIVLGAPEEIKALYFDRLGARCILVPGGGVQPEEFLDLNTCKSAFRAIHPYETPFVLVLGRKSGAKHYRTVITAVELLRQQGTEMNVVLIGPDEDGISIDKSFVFNYGRQPRNVVIGALASSLSLVNMSESESFGIVLLESWMCERPVVANRSCSAFAELVDHGADGILCENAQEVADAVALLASDRERAARMGARGRTKVLQSFTWSAIGAKVNKVLIDLTQETTLGSASAAASSEAATNFSSERANSVVQCR
jgi:glycosyltransferase involved in cell wall biosynthesis